MQGLFDSNLLTGGSSDPYAGTLTTGSSTGSGSGWLSDLLNFASTGFQAYLNYDQQQKIYDLQQSRLKAGLPPLSQDQINAALGIPASASSTAPAASSSTPAPAASSTGSGTGLLAGIGLPVLLGGGFLAWWLMKGKRRR